MKNAALKFCFYACLTVVVASLVFMSPDSAAPVFADDASVLVSTKAKPEMRCGWFANPTPSNAWLNDKDGEWLVSIQGGYQAKGSWGADIKKPNQWVETNGHYGYGCVCMNVTTNKKTRLVLTIKSFSSRPLSVCRKDKKLKEPK
jgi:hypothetical protein